eukprot:7258503-Pyramimonas_sp.AAC.1
MFKSLHKVKKPTPLPRPLFWSGRPTSSSLRPNSSELFAEELYKILGAGGKPSTFVTAGGLVEPA